MIVGDFVKLLRDFFCIIVVAVVNDIFIAYSHSHSRKMNNKQRLYLLANTRMHDLNGKIQHFAFNTHTIG